MKGWLKDMTWMLFAYPLCVSFYGVKATEHGSEKNTPHSKNSHIRGHPQTRDYKKSPTDYD